MTIADNLPGRGRAGAAPTTPHQRRVEIASILLKYGWDALIFRLSLVDFLPAGLKQKLAVSSFLRQEAETSEPEDLALPLPTVLRQILEELGPTFVKLGQVMSTRADIIPQAYIDELTKLQEQVTPAPWHEMEQALLDEWNAQHRSDGPPARTVHDIFPEFDTIPLAAGSLGQVYKAKIRNASGDLQQVIVKLLRPGIETTIEADIAVLLEFARLLTARTNWGRWNNVIGLAEEFSTVIRNELDFTLEGSSTEIIGRNLYRDYGALVKVPQVYWDYSSRRIMTLEFLTGAKVSALFPRRNGEEAPIKLTLAQRQRLTQTLTVAFLRQIFVDGFFHADPHPGNVMFQFRDDDPESLPTLVLIDFGMVGRVDPRSREILIDFLLAMLQFDAARATDRILEYGHPQQLIDKPRLTIEMDHIMREFLGRPVSEVQIGALLNRVMELMLQYRVRMPTSFLMIARVLVTTEGICRQLDKDYMLINVAEPFIHSLVQRQFTSLLSGPELMRIALDWKNILLRTPRRVDDLLAAMNSGQLRIEYEVRNLQRVERTLTVIGNKVSFSLLTAALIVGAALLAPIPNGPHIWGFHAVSFFTFMLGGLLGVWLLISILRSGQLK